MCSGSTSNQLEKRNQLARLAVIDVDSSQLEAYYDFLQEEVEASVRLEPGVITLYAIAEKGRPQHVILFETYQDSSEYQSHLATPHFQKYKRGTIDMVKQLELIPMDEIFYHRKDKLTNAKMEKLYIRLIKIKLNRHAVKDFRMLGNNVMLPGIKKEPGLLAMYALSEKDDPSKISILEVYESINAYNEHLQTPHYQQYKTATKNIVKILKIIDVNPILLGSKSQD